MRRWTTRSRWTWLTGAVAVLALSVGAIAASGSADKTSTGRTPKPVIELGKGDRCVEPTDYMRRNHMKLLKHHRDDVVHQGIRTKKHSLQGCIDCHANAKTNSVIGSNEHFCQSCHTYAAVTMDCWSCHATKPKQAVPTVEGTALAPLPVLGGPQP